MIIVHSYATLLVEPHVGYGFFIKRPTTRVDHERDQEKVHGSTNYSVHFLMLIGIVPKHNRAGLS